MAVAPFRRRIQDLFSLLHSLWGLLHRSPTAQRTSQLVGDAVAAANLKDAEALHVGCGTSMLGLHLLEAGVCTSVLNTDTSPAAVSEMAPAQHAHCNWQVDDCTASVLLSDSFDVVVDKGTMDALGFGVGGAKRCQQMVSEMHRLLRPQGLLIQVTDEPPERGRAQVLEAGATWKTCKWRRVTETVPTDLFGDDEGFEYWMYVATK
jgi:SAM-dependent methyltransferase